MTIQNQNKIQFFASKFINQTNCHLFLTGRAGTGKTTFLKNITQLTHKKTIVAAPTGVAAINAGGVTLHSLFQLPFGTFIPSNEALNHENINIQLNTPRSLLKNFQMNKVKRSLLQELELLIIDEVSMLRADILDAIDIILRYVRKQKTLPFGGIQILFIGDLLQLPPVVKYEEKEYLSPFYPEIHFFNSLALQKQKLLYLELDKIYRQTDEIFISVLNKLRDNKIGEEEIELLNKYYKSSFQPEEKDGFINLTTHNRKADEINQLALKKLPGKSYYFEASISGEFKDYVYPLEYQLELKKGAQIMFVKNDYSGEQRYFNGKIGTISALSKEEIEVSFNDGSPPVSVEHYTWENKKFTLNKETNEIDEKIAGTFIHYPIKLAWAITVHKSQGLTFRKAVIDVSKAFAPGQIYVALSRLTSLDGLVLTEPIKKSAFKQDESIKEFAKNKAGIDLLDKSLNEETQSYIINSAANSFIFNWLYNSIGYHIESYNKDDRRSKKQLYKSWAVKLRQDFKPVKETADKFLLQINNITKATNDNNIEKLHERVLAALNYFDPLFNKFSENITDHLAKISSLKKTKKYQNDLKDLDRLFFSQQEKMHKCEAMLDAIIKDIEFSKETLHQSSFYKDRKSTQQENKKKTDKPKKAEQLNTKEVSYNLYKDGKTIQEIAKERSFAVTTIEGHLAHYVSEGILNVKDFVQQEKLDEIIHVYQNLETKNLKPIKDELGDEFSYTEIRFAVASIKGD